MLTTDQIEEECEYRMAEHLGIAMDGRKGDPTEDMYRRARKASDDWKADYLKQNGKTGREY